MMKLMNTYLKKFNSISAISLSTISSNNTLSTVLNNVETSLMESSNKNKPVESAQKKWNLKRLKDMWTCVKKLLITNKDSQKIDKGKIFSKVKLPKNLISSKKMIKTSKIKVLERYSLFFYGKKWQKNLKFVLEKNLNQCVKPYLLCR